MPLLNINNLPISPAFKAIEIIRARLAAAQGVGGTLNQSVKIGVDAMIKDAQEQAMKDSQMPCARIVYKTTDYLTASNAGSAVAQIVPVYIFFFYYYGKNTGSVLPVHFTDAREAHLRWNIEYLKNLNVLPYNTVGISEAQHEDDAGEIFWNYPEPLVFHIEYDTPFDIFDLALTMPDGMNCCRLDFQIRVRNHATFNSDSLPPTFPTFTYPVYGPNEVLATPNGSSGPLTPRALVLSDLPTIPGAAQIVSEIPAGTIDGTNKIFTTVQIPNGELFLLSLNGLIQGAGDYARSTNTITFTVAPLVGDNLQVFYSY